MTHAHERAARDVASYPRTKRATIVILDAAKLVQLRPRGRLGGAEARRPQGSRGPRGNHRMDHPGRDVAAPARESALDDAACGTKVQADQLDYLTISKILRANELKPHLRPTEFQSKKQLQRAHRRLHHPLESRRNAFHLDQACPRKPLPHAGSNLTCGALGVGRSSSVDLAVARGAHRHVVRAAQADVNMHTRASKTGCVRCRRIRATTTTTYYVRAAACNVVASGTRRIVFIPVTLISDYRRRAAVLKAEVD